MRIVAQLADDYAVYIFADCVVNEFAAADIDADVVHLSFPANAEEDEVARFQIALGNILAHLAL